jgi:hypothetical protein
VEGTIWAEVAQGEGAALRLGGSDSRFRMHSVMFCFLSFFPWFYFPNFTQPRIYCIHLNHIM